MVERPFKKILVGGTKLQENLQNISNATISKILSNVIRILNLNYHQNDNKS